MPSLICVLQAHGIDTPPLKVTELGGLQSKPASAKGLPRTGGAAARGRLR